MEQFQSGDLVRVKIGEWIDGLVELASANGRSLAVSFDEGVPFPSGIKDGRQCLFLLWQDGWRDVLGGRPLLIEKRPPGD